MPTSSIRLLALFALLSVATAYPQNTISTVAGGGGLANGPATSVIVPFPFALARDSNGNIFILSETASAVYRLDQNGQLAVVAGIGLQVYTGNGGPALQASFNVPSALATDLSGNLLVAQQAQSAVLKIDMSTGIINAIAGTGADGFSGDNGPATQAQLGNPQGVAVDPHGNIYISDTSNNRIRRVDAQTGTITTVAGNGTPGFSGDSGPATAAMINGPVGAISDSLGNIYFIDARNFRIRRIDAQTGVITTYAGNGNRGFGGDGGAAINASFNFIGPGVPAQLTFDLSGNLYVADQFNERIRRIDAKTGTISTVAGVGQQGAAGDGGSALAAQLGDPSGVLVDGSGNIYIGDNDNDRVRKVNAQSSIITTVAGNGSLGDGGPATSAVLFFPQGVAVDNAGNVLIADSNASLIRSVSPNGTTSTVAGLKYFFAFNGDGGPATTRWLNFPIGVTTDLNRNIFIADSNNNRVRRVDAVTGIIATVAGNGSAGFSGDSGPATSAALFFPSAVAFDQNGNFFISDSGNQRIRRVDAISGIITTVAGNGTTGFAGDGGPAVNASLNLSAPFSGTGGLAFDAAGNLFFSDSSNNRVRKVDAVTGIITTVAGSSVGCTFFPVGDGGPAASANLCFPEGLASDAIGNLIIADTSQYRVRRVDANTGTISTIAGNGTAELPQNGAPATQVSLAGPRDVTLDTHGMVYIVTSNSARVLKLALAPVASVTGSFSDFGLVSVGGFSDPQTITITNNGSATLLLTNISVGGDFGIASQCGLSPLTVAPLQSCGLIAFFNPMVAGPQVAKLSLSSNDPTHPSYSFNLSGTGFVGPTLAISPSSLSFGNAITSTTTPAQTVTVSNTGETSVSISSIAISGVNAASFAQTNNCPISPALLLPGNNCQIFVTFTPLALGANNASLVITDSQGVLVNTQQNVSLTGTGTDVPVVASTTYTITGNPFTTFEFAAACPPICRLTGSFSVSTPLAPNLSNATIIPASFSFNVGPVVLTQGNTITASFANISTDADGNLISWNIFLTNATYLMATANGPDMIIGETYQQNSPQGLPPVGPPPLAVAFNNNPAPFTKVTVVPLTFPVSNTPVSQVATVNCPSGTVPCTDPNAHSLKLTVPQVSSGFTLTVTSYEVPLSQANGICEKGETETTDFDCRFVANFPIQFQANGDIIVPQCIPYSDGNCIFYRVGNTPSTTAYQSPVTEYIAWNNNSFVPPVIYQANNPRLYDDPEDPPYNLNHQFVFDITNYYQPTGETVGVDAGIVGQTLHFNDFVVAYPGVPPAGSANYAFAWLPPLKGNNKSTVFAAGASIPVSFQLTPNSPAGVATAPPNHVGYGVLLDTGNTGCKDFTGVRQPALTIPSTQTNFVYDPKHQTYHLKLAGTYKPGNYKLLINTGLSAEQCSPFIVTP